MLLAYAHNCKKRNDLTDDSCGKHRARHRPSGRTRLAYWLETGTHRVLFAKRAISERHGNDIDRLLSSLIAQERASGIGKAEQ
jgi:hypothetical protein